MSESIENFLDQHAGEGRAVSEGHFTLSGERAFRKLADFSVNKPEQWVLKWVQGAVAGKAEKIEFVQSRRSTIARAWLPSPLSVKHMEAALLGMEAVRTPFWREAVIGMRALLTRGSVALACGQEKWGWDGSRVREPSALPLLKGSTVAVEFIPETTPRAAWQSQEARELQSRCLSCRTPIWLDSIQINSETARPQSAHSPLEHGMFSPRLLAVGWIPWNGELESEPEVARPSAGRDRLRSGRPFLYWPEVESPPGRTLAFRLFVSHGKRGSLVGDLLRSKSDSSSELLDDVFRAGASRYGVLCGVMESREFAGLGGELVVEGDELRTDFSGLAVERDEDWWRLLRLAFLKFQRTLRRLTYELKDYEPDSAVSDVKAGLADVFSGLAAGALAGLKGGPLGVVITGPVGAYIGYQYSTFEERELVGKVKKTVSVAQASAEKLGKEGLTAHTPGWRRVNLD